MGLTLGEGKKTYVLEEDKDAARKELVDGAAGGKT